MAGELSKANRKKALARAVKVLPPGTEVRGFVVGRAQARWSNGAIGILAAGLTLVYVRATGGARLTEPAKEPSRRGSGPGPEAREDDSVPG